MNHLHGAFDAVPSPSISECVGHCPLCLCLQACVQHAIDSVCDMQSDVSHIHVKWIASTASEAECLLLMHYLLTDASAALRCCKADMYCHNSRHAHSHRMAVEIGSHDSKLAGSLYLAHDEAIKLVDHLHRREVCHGLFIVLITGPCNLMHQSPVTTA